MVGIEAPPYVGQGLADLAHGGVGPDRGQDGRDRVGPRPGCGVHLLEGDGYVAGVAVPAQAGQRLDLRLLDGGQVPAGGLTRVSAVGGAADTC